MRNCGWLVLGVLTALLAALVAPAFGEEPADQPYFGRLTDLPSEAADRLVVKFAPDVSDAQALRIHRGAGARLIERGYANAFQVVRVPAWARDKALGKYRQHPEVVSAEPDHVATALYTPNDPYFFPYQWNFYNHGVISRNAASDYGVQAQTAWNTTNGAGVIVAVVDTGIAYENYGRKSKLAPDLAGTQFVAGYNFVNNTTHANDDNGHGTHVAGTIAQTTNNSLGTAGIANSAKLMQIG